MSGMFYICTTLETASPQSLVMQSFTMCSKRHAMGVNFGLHCLSWKEIYRKKPNSSHGQDKFLLQTGYTITSAVARFVLDHEGQQKAIMNWTKISKASEKIYLPWDKTASLSARSSVRPNRAGNLDRNQSQLIHKYKLAVYELHSLLWFNYSFHSTHPFAFKHMC